MVLRPKARPKYHHWGHRPPQALDRECLAEDDGFSSQRAAASARAPPLYEGQIFQMLADMKEQMKVQQAQSDRDWKQAALDRNNAVKEQEALKQHNDQLQAQIVTLQKKPRSRQNQRTNLRPGRLKPTALSELEAVETNFPLHEDCSDDKVDSPHFQMGAQHS